MRLMKFSYHLFCRNILISILIVVQLVVSLLLLNDVIETANGYFVTVDEYASCNLPNINGLIVDAEDKIPNRILNKISKESIKYRENGYSVYSGEFKLCGYSKDFVKDYVPEIKEGKWLNQCSTNSKVVPVVVPYSDFNEYSVGDEIDIDSDNNISAKVVGILKSPYYCSFSGAGIYYDTKTILKTVNDEDDASTPLLTLSDYLPKDSLGFRSSQAIIFKNGSDIKEADKVLSKYYEVRTFKDVMDNGISEAFSRVRTLGPLIITLLLVSIFGMIGCIAISTYKNIKFFSILYICGASTKKSFLISILYTAIYIVITLIAFFIIFIFIMDKSLCWLNYIALLIMTLMLLSLSLIPYKILKNNPPIKVLKENK